MLVSDDSVLHLTYPIGIFETVIFDDWLLKRSVTSTEANERDAAHCRDNHDDEANGEEFRNPGVN